MNRPTRTYSERFQARTSCAGPTLVAVLLLLTVVPGAAAYAVVENDIALRTTIRDTPRREDGREATRAVSTLAAAIKATVEAPTAVALLPTGVSIVRFEPREGALSMGHTGAFVAVAGGVRAALLNLPPPIG